MTATVSAPRVPFWRDVRVLRWLLQLLVVGAVLAFLWWLYGNYTESVENQNIPTNFDFLDNPANFQITGNPLSANAPVRDAIVEGLLNTLRVSVVGIILATILGTLIGIARLSHNWLLNKIAAVYVEAVRNVPLALFLVAGLLVVVLGVFPTIQEAWDFGGWAVVSNRGVAVPWFEGGSGLVLVAIFLLAVVTWIAIAKWRESVADRTGATAHGARWGLAGFAVVLIGGWLLFGYSLTRPEVAGRRTEGGIRIDPSFFALLFALVIYTASHIAEIVRGSIQAVHKGQGEAADALALSGSQRMWYVILPQAFRIAIPPIGNQYLNLIGYYDLTLVAQTTVGNGSPAVPVFALTMALYISLSLITSVFVNIANRRMALVER